YPAVHQHAHGPVPPGQGVHEVGYHLAQPAAVGTVVPPGAGSGRGSFHCVSRSGLDVLQVLQQTQLTWLPAECLPGAGAHRGLVGREDRAERAESFLRYRLGRDLQPSAMTVAMSRTASPWSLTACHAVPAGAFSRTS